MNYGEDFKRYFWFVPPEHSPFSDDDKVLFVIRRKKDVVYWRLFNLIEDTTKENTWYCYLHITHQESEASLSPGTYAWGISLYRDAEIIDEKPVNGVVKTPVASAEFIVN
jgi:hypothetical protein